MRRETQYAKRKRAASHPDDGQDITYEQRSRTPISETFSYEDEPPRKKQPQGPPHGGVGNDAMSKALNQISRDEALMCKVFPFSLGPMAMRWFDNLEADSIDSYQELTQVFGSHFVTCRRVARPLSSLLSLSMREGESFKAYSDRYWEMFNDMKGNLDAMAIETFKLGLPIDHGLRTFLSGKPVTNMRQLMDRIEKYKRVEEDQQ
ncbi:uncharacterized protein LOC136066737 [Quercus suber]|uniref:uncharacterized protein LOC136066737 n=1 Tax=Quercus suber TaxID=58331 RepID=UPI0032DF9FDB